MRGTCLTALAMGCVLATGLTARAESYQARPCRTVTCTDTLTVIFRQGTPGTTITQRATLLR